MSASGPLQDNMLAFARRADAGFAFAKLAQRGRRKTGVPRSYSSAFAPCGAMLAKISHGNATNTVTEKRCDSRVLPKQTAMWVFQSSGGIRSESCLHQPSRSITQTITDADTHKVPGFQPRSTVNKLSGTVASPFPCTENASSTAPSRARGCEPHGANENRSDPAEHCLHSNLPRQIMRRIKKNV